MYIRWTGNVNEGARIHPTWDGSKVRAGFSFRQGGVSEAPWDTLNLSYRVGDGASKVLQNRERWSDVGFGSIDDWVVGEQVHGSTVTVVGMADRGRGAREERAPVSATDALVTNTPGLTLMVLTADCVPVLLYDKRNHAIGAVHSGWRGTVSHIVLEVIQTMQTTFGTYASDLLVAIGPSIRSCCYEVDETVAGPVCDEFGRTFLRPRYNREGKYLLSLQSCIRHDLLNAGVGAVRIEDCGVCTSCHSDVLFSHRADLGRSGRQCASIRLETPS